MIHASKFELGDKLNFVEFKDTFIVATAWDARNRDITCEYIECPKHGWIRLTMGFESMDGPVGDYHLCPTHYAEMMEDWAKDFLPGMLESFRKSDRKEYGLE